MTPNYNFPSARKMQITEIEGKYLCRHIQPLEQPTHGLSWLADVLLVSVLVGGIVGLALTIFMLYGN